MAPDAAARAFDRFWRGDPSRPRGGAGLGLPIVRGIVAAHHGEVSLDTSPDAGTTVRVALAVATTSSAPAPGAAGSPEP
jgi:two-component system OmpR family sensor kinase